VIDIKYLAGFFDGEGCVTISHTRKTHFTVVVSVSNTHLPTLKAIQNVFGGNIYGTKASTRMKRDRYTLVWAGNKKAQALLSLLSPFCITKKEQIDFVLTVYLPTAGIGKRRTKMDSSIIANRLAMAQKLSTMKLVEYPINTIAN